MTAMELTSEPAEGDVAPVETPEARIARDSTTWDELYPAMRVPPVTRNEEVYLDLRRWVES